MTTHRYQAKRTDEQQLYGMRLLPIDYPCAIYARQSTARQVVEHRESAEMQTTEIWNFALQMGWTDEKIVLYIENRDEDGAIKNASGTLRIDERTGLSALMERVYRDEIKAILVYNESRLFRDEWQIQVDTFIQACYEHDVRVITHSYHYDFRQRSFDMDEFRLQARIAADYIKNHVKGLLLPARQRKAMRGLVMSGSAPTGYVVELDKHSETYRKLIPYKPHAEVIVWIFKRYRELGGRLYELGRELSKQPFVFPDYDVTPPDRVRVKKVPGGYTISRNGLTHVLTNVAYIGWWTVNGVVVSKSNHEPIVSEDNFWYAYNRLCDVTPDGEPQERTGTLPARYNKLTTVPVKALLADVITGEGDKRVYASAKNAIYRIHDNVDAFTRITASISIKRLDAVFVNQLLEKLQLEELTGYNEGVHTRLRDTQQQTTVITSIDYQLTQVNARMVILRRNLDLEADEQSVKAWAKELRELAAVNEALEKKARSLEESKNAATEYSDLLEQVMADWNSLSFKNQRRFVNLAVDKVILSEVSPHFFQVVIVWALHTTPYRVDVGYIFDALGNQERWNEEDESVLRAHYVTADRAKLLESLPSRSWNAIRAHGCTMGLVRPKHNVNTSTVRPEYALEDVELLKQVGIDEQYYGEEEYWSLTQVTSDNL